MAEAIFLKFLGYIEIPLCTWGICQAEFKRKKSIFLYGTLAVLSTCILTWIELEYEITIYTILATLLIHIFLSSVMFRGKLLHNIIMSMFSSVYLDVLYLPVRTLYAIFQLNNYPIFLRFGEAIMSLIVISIVYLIGLQIKKHKQWVRWIQNIPIGYFVIGYLFAFTAFGISSFIYQTIDDTWSRQQQIILYILWASLTLFLYFFGIAIAFVNLMKENYRRESILKDEYLKKSKEHYQNLKNHIEEVQKIRHDMKNHLYLLETYMEQGEWEKARSYLKEIDSHQQWNHKPLINIGNDLVNAVLNSGLENIDPDIAFKTEGLLPPTLEIQEFDLCTIFSNLLSNSIEACAKLKEHEKTILLSIHTFQDQMIISFKNPVEEDIKPENLGKYSTKKDKQHHGYGIQNIIDAVEKYDGSVDFLIENNQFEVKICLHLTAYS